MISNYQKLINFTKEILEAANDGGGDLDGFDFQDICEKHGILSPVIQHAPCGEYCVCSQACSDEEFAEGVKCYQIADWLLVEQQEYTRPELTAEDHDKAEAYARATFRKYGIGKVVIMVAALCLENVALVKEINEHRAARGIAPLEVFEVK
jgi:hypothetical protein